MALVAVAERILDVPVEVAFKHFCNYSEWDRWMPRNFRPLSGPARELRPGDHVRVGLGPAGRLSRDLEVVRVRPNKELCLRGGVGPLLHGDRSIVFSSVDGGKTCVRCEDPLAGVLTLGPLSGLLEKQLARAGTELLERFAAYLHRAAQLQPSAASVSCASR
jgi:hypothetical protein